MPIYMYAYIYVCLHIYVYVYNVCVPITFAFYMCRLLESSTYELLSRSQHDGRMVIEPR